MAFRLKEKEAAELDILAQEFEAAKSALADRLDEIASEWESALEEKSDRWKDGDAGQAAQERIDLIRNWFDELPGEGEPAINSDDLI